MLKLITAATSLAVSVERAKERLHIDSGDFDNDILRLIMAATGALEKETGTVAQASSWEYRAGGWSGYWYQPNYWSQWSFESGFSPAFPTLRIPSAPVRDVTGVTYLDENNAEQTIDPANYTWERTTEGADVLFNSGYVLPTLSNRPQAVRVAFDAGYTDPADTGSGDDPALVLPPTAEIAILFLVGLWNANREAASDSQTYTVPQTFEYLAQQMRVYR